MYIKSKEEKKVKERRENRLCTCKLSRSPRSKEIQHLFLRPLAPTLRTPFLHSYTHLFPTFFAKLFLPAAYTSLLSIPPHTPFLLCSLYIRFPEQSTPGKHLELAFSSNEN